MEVLGSVGQGERIPNANGGTFIILLPSDEDNDVTYIPCDLLTALSFLRMAKRLGAEGNTAFYISCSCPYHLGGGRLLRCDLRSKLVDKQGRE